MKMEIAEKWVAALRSSKYKKTIGQLHTKNKSGSQCFCALGVLADLYRKENGGSWSQGALVHKGKSSGFRVAGYLNDDIKNWAGMFCRTGSLKEMGEFSVSRLNDRKDSNNRQVYNFDDLALFIETYWEFL